MSARHASEPDSRPPPVSFSPPNAPPISAPLVPRLTLAIPQSDPAGGMEASGARLRGPPHLERLEDGREGLLPRDRERLGGGGAHQGGLDEEAAARQRLAAV